MASMFLGYLNSTIIVQANEDNNTLTLIMNTVIAKNTLQATWVSENTFRIQDKSNDFLIVPSTPFVVVVFVLFCFVF